MSNVVDFIPKKGRFRLERIADGKKSSFIILDPTIGVFPAGQAYIRELAQWASSNPKTVRASAYIIIDWCNYLRAKGHSWSDANSGMYLDWVKSQKVLKTRLARKNSVIWRWYKFLHSHHLYKYDAELLFHDISSPTIDREFGKPRYTAKRGSGPEISASKSRKSTTIITDDTVESLVGSLADLGNSFRYVRDSLIVEFEYRCGLRAGGPANILISSISGALGHIKIIPAHESILSYSTDRAGQVEIRRKLDALKDLGSKGIIIRVTEKFSKSRDVMIRVDLVHQVLDFVWKFHERWMNPGTRSYRRDGHLFLSLKTGGGLLPGTISDIVKHYFNRFGLGGSGHDLRKHRVTARALELVIESKKSGKLFDGVAIEMALADEFGHDDFVTIRPYLNIGRILDAIGEEMEGHYKR